MSRVPEIAYDDAVSRCPMAFLSELRETMPVVKLTSPVESLNGYMVSRTRDMMSVARDPATFSSLGHPMAERFGDYNAEVGAIYRENGWPLERTLVWIDPPEHGKFRKVAERIFTPASVNQRAGHIQICIDKLIAAFPDSGEIDGVADFAVKFPAMVMTREFNAGEDDYQVLIDGTNAIGQAIDFTRGDPQDADGIVAEAALAITQFQQFMIPLIDAVRDTPNNTMLSELVNAKDKDGNTLLTLGELLSILVIFLTAATDSTTGATGWALHMLAQHQDIQARLRREPDKIEAFVEEVLRQHGTIATSFRACTRDTEIAGGDMPAGAQVFLRWDSSNFDPEKWADPERFDIDRPNGRAHLSFGHGTHFCVGNTLARKELNLMVAAFLNRFARIESAGTPDQLASLNVHALLSLPLKLTLHSA